MFALLVFLQSFLSKIKWIRILLVICWLIRILLVICWFSASPWHSFRCWLGVVTNTRSHYLLPQQLQHKYIFSRTEYSLLFFYCCCLQLDCDVCGLGPQHLGNDLVGTVVSAIAGCGARREVVINGREDALSWARMQCAPGPYPCPASCPSPCLPCPSSCPPCPPPCGPTCPPPCKPCDPCR